MEDRSAPVLAVAALTSHRCAMGPSSPACGRGVRRYFFPGGFTACSVVAFTSLPVVTLRP